MRAELDRVSDDELVLRFNDTGEYDYFDEIVRRHQETLSRYATRFLADRELARDAVQDCFLRVFSGLRRYRAEGKLRAWLFAVLRSSCLDALRRAPRETSLVASGTTPERAPVDGDEAYAEPAAAAEKKERSRILLHAVGALPAGYREAIILRFFHELDYAEIGRVLGIKENACRQRVHQAVRRLGDTLPSDL